MKSPNVPVSELAKDSNVYNSKVRTLGKRLAEERAWLGCSVPG